MRKFSKKRARQERNLRKIEAELIAEGKTRCFFFPHKRASSFDHIVSKAQNQSLIDCKSNLVPTSSEAHHIIDHGENHQIRKLPNIKKYLAKMKELDEKYWRRFMTNHELWDDYE